MNNGTPRILICRLSAIGDVIHGVPMACALRDKYPKAFIGWLVEGRAAQVLKGHKSVDKLFILPRGWLKSFSEVLNLRKALRAEKFDVAVDPQGLFKSSFAAWLSGAKKRVGFARPDGREMSHIINNTCVKASATHVVDRNIELLAPLGVEDAKVEFRIHEDFIAAKEAKKFIGSEINGEYAVVNPGAGWPSKRWPLTRYSIVAKYIKDNFGLPTLVVWGGREEEKWAREIVDGAGGCAIMSPKTDLLQLAALLRRAKIFVGSDTGPLHLAAAFGTRCVGLYGPMPAERNGPYGEGHEAIQVVRLEGTSRERRSAGPESMEAITVEMVCEACSRILKSEGC